MIQRFHNPDGPDVSTAAGRVISRDGRYFRDPAGTGELLPYADWRRGPEERARDLAGRLSLEQIAGLMLYSPHQMVPTLPGGPFRATYGGREFDPAVHDPAALSDQQRDLLLRDHIRHVLVVSFADVDTAVTWHNAMQELAEREPFGVPINFSSDPRHGASDSAAEFKSHGVAVSKWPEGLGIAATFSPDTCRRFADAVRQEYRALGITTALGPQVDLATEPRWMRAVDTFGGQVDQATELAKTYIDTVQTTPGSAAGWGPGSVVAMAKHWPGGGTGEGGRDAHYRFGMYNVYPGGNFAEHLRPFTEGALALDGPTRAAGAIMPYYSVSVGQAEGEVGNSYSRHLIADLLRGEYGYDGVVCTDWGITGDSSGELEGFESRCFGVEHLTVAERHLRLILNGVDQFGGNSDAGPVLEAYALGCQQHGEEAMRARFEQSAVRLLRGMFRVGLFDDPYLDADTSRSVVGREDFVTSGFQAQLDSIVTLKGGAPLPRGSKVWVPRRHVDEHKGFFRRPVPASDSDGFDPAIAGDYFTLVERPEDADAALVAMVSPMSDPYVDGFRPISLQYRPYDAPTAREPSLAGDRSYRGRPAVVANTADLDNLEEARRAMGGRPVVAVLRLDVPVVMAEVEPLADSVYVHFGVSQRALLDVVSGSARAGGRLPVTLPRDMATIEAHREDVFNDYEPYVDAAGHRYKYGFGLGAES
ncbi:MAG TPA: glycoside hydrolase family 3 N-terminal domain-containing protein [Propionibacteriaceae bacterium]|nr:glycoside hydrolase family 3 N-terminal domain-containing protein [Propionibacteriaceae bacterium]